MKFVATWTIVSCFVLFAALLDPVYAQGFKKLKALKGASNVNVYFSDEPFTVGMENSLKNADAELSDEDMIYGMAVVDKEAFNRSFVRDYCYLGDKKTYLGAHVVFENGKTYVFFDILPDPNQPSSLDAIKWSKIITSLPAGKTKSLRIEVTASKMKAVGTLKLRRSGKRDAEITSNAEQAVTNFQKVLEQRENQAEQQEQAERDREDKSRELPDAWRVNDLAGIEGEPALDTREKVESQIKSAWEDVAEVVYLSRASNQEWSVFVSTENEEIVSHKRTADPIKVVYKQTGGEWCTAVEVFFGRRNIGGLNTQYGPLYVDTDKGFRFDCGKL